MEGFMEAWKAIDITANLQITSQELRAYMLKNNYEEGFIRKWLDIFDTDGSGIIRLREFCDSLGFNYKETVSEVQQNATLRGVRTLGGGMPVGVEVLKSGMEKSWEIIVIELCLEGLRSHQHLREVPCWIKKQADDRYSKLWHVVILKGQFWSDYGHAPGYSLIFKYEKFIFLIWKTPVA